MGEYTPGPYQQSCFAVQAINKWGHRETIAHCGMGQLPPSRSNESEQNARRIVACLTAFDGISTEDIERIGRAALSQPDDTGVIRAE